MFFPRAMSEIDLIVPSKDLLPVMKVLSGHGVFHQSDGTAAGIAAETISGTTWQERASTYAALERRLQTLRQTLGAEDLDAQPREFDDVIEPEVASDRVGRLELAVREITDELADVRKRLEQVQATRRELEPVAEVDINMDVLRTPHFLYAILGVMPAENVGRLQTSLARIPHSFLVLRDDPKSPVVWLASTQSNRDVVERASRSAYVEAANLPEEYAGSPREIITTLEAQSKELSTRVSTMEEALRQLAARYRSEILALGWEVHASRTLADAIARFGRLRHTYIVVGWTPTDGLSTLTQKLRQVSRDTVVETIPTARSGDRRNVPVALQNARFLRPFQMLVTTYARPRYGEIDPTWLIALTFPLLFGAMFGDLGHGLLLAVLGLVISSRKVPALRGLAGLGGLITACGVLAGIFGVLYGSVFGFEDILPALWMHPGNDPIQILAVAVGAGVVLLTIGYLIGIFNGVVSRSWSHLLFGHNGIAGFVLYLSILGFLATKLGVLRAPSIVFLVLLIVSALAIMFSELLMHLVDHVHPLLDGGVVSYGLQAGMELFEAVLTIVSNSLSYVRIGAFAIAHVVLSSVVFLLAGLLSPAHGLVYWIVIAVGTVGIVAYEGLIVGIQAMRLSYYEFFSKFFSGGGMRFEPLSLSPTEDT